MSIAPSGLAPARGPLAGGHAQNERPRLRLLGPRRHTRGYVLAALLIAAAGIFGVVSLNALAAEAAFEARALERDVDELTLRYDELTAEVAALSAPSRVREVAREQLGMVPVEEAGFLFAAKPPVGDEAAEELVASSDAELGLDRHLEQALGGR